MKGNVKTVYPVVRHADFSTARLVKFLYTLRRLPGFPLSIDGMLGFGFVLLNETPPTGFAMGLTGQFWKLDGGLIRVEPAEFVEFQRDGFSQVVWVFELESTAANRVRITTRTSVRSCGEAARRKMRNYWYAIYPFSRYIRRAVLRSIEESLN